MDALLRRTLGLTGLLFVGALAPTAWAQTTPGTVQDTLKPPPELQRPTESPVVAPPRSRPQPPPSDRTLVVQRFIFGGNSVFSNEQLATVVAEYQGRPITLLEIYDAADRIADLYVSNGYTLASVSVPAQRVSDGTVRLEVIEGRYGEVMVEGNESYEAAHLKRYLGEIPFGGLYRVGELEEGMRELNKLPGLQAKAILRPGSIYGTSDVVIQADETRVAGAFVVDNYGRENIGEMRWSVSVQINNPTHSADQLQLLGLRSEDGRLNYGYVAYSLPLNHSGVRAIASYGHADFEIPENNLEGSNENSRLQVNFPVFAGDGASLRLMPAVSRTESTVDLFGNPTALGTSITLAELGAVYNRQYENLAVTQVNAEISSNFQNATAIDRNAQRFKLEIDSQHLQPIGKGLLAFVRLHGVYSDDPLPDTERFSIGGPNSVRGYPASEIRGDRGLFGTLSLRRPFRLGDARMQGRVFFDTGKAWLRGLPPGSPDEDSLSSIGIGLDASLKGNINLKLDWAFPRDDDPGTREVSDNKVNSRVFGSLTVGF